MKLENSFAVCVMKCTHDTHSFSEEFDSFTFFNCFLAEIFHIQKYFIIHFLVGNNIAGIPKIIAIQ